VLRLVVRRLLQGVLTVYVATTVSFFLIHLAPGDPFAEYAQGQSLPPQVRDQLMRTFGFDKPLWLQYFLYLAAVARGDLGWSLSSSRPVADVLADALPHTVILATAGLALSIVGGVIVGVVQAIARRRASGRVLGATALFFYSVPEFWLGLALLMVFAAWLRIFPTGGAYDLGSYDYFTTMERVLDRLKHLTLPAVTIALGTAAAIARHQRGALLDVAREDFVRTARAKGCSERRVLFRHALRNALLPVITLLGLAFPALVSGVVFVERIFGWPGMGGRAVQAVGSRDYALVTGIVILGSAAVAIGGLVADILHAAADPRVREHVA
jgi:peptide/nickel transport system permease protein